MRKLAWALIVALALLGAWTAIPHLLPRLGAWLQPQLVWRGDAGRKIIYLSIDDAPTKGTKDVLAVLAKHRVHATFFIIAGRVKSDADLQAILDAGHSLGNHMRTTRACSKLSLEQFKADFDSTDALLSRFTKPSLFRPPSDLGTSAQLTYVREKGYLPVSATIFPLDPWFENVGVLSFLDRWLAIPGGIFLMHDGDTRGARTAATLDIVIPKLRAAGYEFADLTALPPTVR